MITNKELFMKMMIASKKMRMDAFRRPEDNGCERMHGHPMHRMPMMKGVSGPGPEGEGRGHFRPEMMPKHSERRMSRERLLAIVSEFPEGINQKTLAERAGINASSTSEVVTKLEDDGYLVREIDPNDRRATVLKLTEMGQVRAEEVRSEREGFIDEMFIKLNDEEKQTLSDILDKLIGRPEEE